MANSLTYSGQLTVTTCWCGMRHAVPVELYDFQQRQHRDGEKVTAIYCPLGHSWVPSGKSEAETLRERLAREQARRISERDQLSAALDHEKRRRAATQGQLTKTRKRIGKGTCPCCNRHFANLRGHMESKHPEYADEA